MKVEKNKALVRRYVDEVQNEHCLEALDTIFSKNFVDHSQILGSMFQNIDGLKRGYTDMLAAFPDFHVTINEQIGEGNKVVTHKTITATHAGEFRGIAATHRQVEFQVIDIFTINDGLISECWFLFEEYKLMQQIGAIDS
ncbi:MAG: ester cyclase [Pseudomonadota bacterium]